MSCSWTGVSISARSGPLSIFPVSPSLSACSQGATEAALERALLGQRALPLEEALHALAAAHAALGSDVAGHLDAPPLAGADAVMALRGHVPHGQALEAGRLERADRRLAARARALD